ncbi:Predicted arabinose efflux permease, MFS family [Pseudomonas flavescens]|uniref:Predicted arabinose efflux permease, MFS family n=1 Tax=Phytopseudomonas flavescens TaxID=29435 RepID=A0A1G8QK66_9GAMM|nr:MFS transporter [Pseudomonas flavescens]SDJ05199.1 Predicted arabinose efflux permease, MFS family [Pseudomonas flavescens]
MTPTDVPRQAAESTRGFSLWPLMFETFACTVAVMSFVVLIGPLARVLGLAPWQAGATVAVVGITWALLARAWGAASDRLGRRRVLLGGLCGFVIAYTALALFVIVALDRLPPAWLAFAVIVVLRGLAGAFYAAIPATSAALVADHLAPENRTRAMASIGAATAVGMVAGPGLAGWLAVYDLRLPLYLTTLLPLLALLVMWRWLPRSEHHAPPGRAPLRIADARLRRALAVGFAAMFSVTAAQVTVGFFALDRLQLPSSEAARSAGIALTAVGVALILSQVLVRLLNWSPMRLIRVGGVVAAAGFGSVMLADSSVQLWAGFFVSAAGMGWVFPSVSALAVNAVEPHEKGAAAGTLGAAHGMGMISGPLLGTLVYEFDSGAPYALIAVLLLATVLWPHRQLAAP